MGVTTAIVFQLPSLISNAIIAPYHPVNNLNSLISRASC